MHHVGEKKERSRSHGPWLIDIFLILVKSSTDLNVSSP